MILAYRYLFPFMWLLWAAYWWLAARGNKPIERRESPGSRLLHMLPLLLVGWLVWTDRLHASFLTQRFFRWAPWQFWFAALITATGLLFAVWARVHLGRNWSGTVTIKQDHELIDSGPYALVRHPIYTGLLFAFMGSAVARGDWRGILAFLIAWTALWRKLRLEERWMVDIFGQQYEAYRQRVPALIPFSKWRKSV